MVPSVHVTAAFASTANVDVAPADVLVDAASVEGDSMRPAESLHAAASSVTAASSPLVSPDVVSANVRRVLRVRVRMRIPPLALLPRRTDISRVKRACTSKRLIGIESTQVPRVVKHLVAYGGTIQPNG